MDNLKKEIFPVSTGQYFIEKKNNCRSSRYITTLKAFFPLNHAVTRSPSWLTKEWWTFIFYFLTFWGFVTMIYSVKKMLHYFVIGNQQFFTHFFFGVTEILLSNGSSKLDSLIFYYYFLNQKSNSQQFFSCFYFLILNSIINYFFNSENQNYF